MVRAASQPGNILNIYWRIDRMIHLVCDMDGTVIGTIPAMQFGVAIGKGKDCG